MAIICNLVDAENFQRDINSIYEWAASESNMEYNPDKFQLLRYGQDQDIKESTGYLDPCGHPITSVEVARDLGVQMSNTGSFDQHTRKTIQNCNFTLSQIFRLFSDRSATTMLQLYKSLVLSKIDYCSVLVTPTSASLRNDLEKVQRRFTKKIVGMTGIGYWERLEKLKLQSIQRRHERYAIIYAYKVITGLVPNFGLTWNANPRSGIHLVVPCVPPTWQSTAFARKLVEGSVTYRLSRLYNILPRSLRSTLTSDRINHIELFKKSLDLYLATIPDEPTDYRRMRAAASNSLLDQCHYSSLSQH